MASAFNLLTAGARFDKSRFGKDIDLFQKEKSKGKAKALPASLNFFGDSKLEQALESESESESEPERDVPEPPKQKITLTGPDPLPASLGTELESLFKTDSPLKRPLLRALSDANIHSMWGVQCAVAGSLLSGHDTMCIAPTGSGKTLSYLLPTLVSLEQPARKLENVGIRSIIVVPTHDLAVQIHGVLKAITTHGKWRCLVLSKATQDAVCQSSPPDGESGLGIDVLVATPERLHHLLEEKKVSLSG